MLLFTNRQDFFNDICEEIRLFLPGEEIAPVLSPAEIHAADAGEKTLSVVLSNDGTDFLPKPPLFRTVGSIHTHAERPFAMMIQLLKSVFQNGVLKSLSSAQCERHTPMRTSRGVL